MRRLGFIGLCIFYTVNLLAQSPHGPKLKMDCAACHDASGWTIPADKWRKDKQQKPQISKTTGAVLDPKSKQGTVSFDHNTTLFPLDGQHASTDCRACHQTLVFSGAPTTCVSCHQDVHQQTVGTDCKRCHTTSNWQVNQISALHQENGFPLTDVHAALQCSQCHTSDNPLRFDRIGNDCINCHTKDFQASVNPNHVELGLSMQCASCHTTKDPGWAPASFDVHNTYYVLEGAHAPIAKDCASCHNGDYTNTPNTCVGCHAEQYNEAAKPNHVQLKLPTDCASCHSQDAWTPSTFDHAKVYPFTGAHIPIAEDCASCHKGDYSTTPKTCAGCHTDAYNASLNPNHRALAIPMDCASCHTTAAGWAPASFPTHNSYYPLEGAHQAVAQDCASCHHGDYNDTPTTCAGCHSADYAKATNPNHQKLALSTDCASCHTVEPGWAPASFPDHNQVYPLEGVHASTSCASCHKGDYTQTPNTCVGCHTADYEQTKNPSHAAARLSTDCATCHSPEGWSPSSFDHNTFYPLTGAHHTIRNDCNACHNGDYTNTPTTCAGCHTDTYNATKVPNHAAAKISTDCASCHSTSGWTPSSFDHNTYPLTGAHQVIRNDCNACHNGNYTTTPNTCAGCHTDAYNQSKNPDHKVLGLSMDCASCHTTTPGWAPAAFAIHNSFYKLEGAHARIAADCASCHNGDYNNTPNTCMGCHSTAYTSAKSPDHVGAKFPTDCASCHSQEAWSPSSFDHNIYYPLTGGHHTIRNDCNACHNGDYTNTPTTCAGCHTDTYNATKVPNHAAAKISTDCASCHTTSGWTPSTFDHHTYPLTGAHQVIRNDCNACHNGNYTTTPNTCAGCHTAAYNESKNPDHKRLGLSMDCASCHSTAPGWAPATFAIHNSFYKLEGAHARIAGDCASCHNGDYNNTPNTCMGCHSTAYTSAKSPDHVGAKFPTDCASCHSQEAWSPSSFDHNIYYPLTGGHHTIRNDCNACHNGDYTNTPTTCAGCHTDTYNATKVPNHAAAKISTDCASCHTTSGWTPSTFDHHTYPLTGAHQVIRNDCNACHNGNYTTTPNTCAGCHTGSYNESKNPDHKRLGLSMDCASCHSTAPGWAPATFAVHNSFYKLEGAHARIAGDCASCHNGDYNNTPNTCMGCHSADYTSAKSPDHVGAKFPTDCMSCHSQEGWTPSSFNHNVYYPLTGAHRTIRNDCNACHNGDYTNTPTTCAGCHTDAYNATKVPNHVTAKISTDCASCHSTSSWSPSTFDHSTYPLTGAHQVIRNDCNACHQGNYTTTPNTCAGCHTKDFQGARNPNHTTLGLSTDCASCHTTTPGWAPADFPDHNSYYILQGAHAAIAKDCATCHSGDYTNTPNTCAGCHTADYNGAQNPNHVAANLPTDCTTCHSQDAWSPSSFNHDVYYPIEGAHNAIRNDCNACHSGDYTNTPTTCAGCHIADYNGAQNPNHVAANLPMDCTTCHSQDAWAPSSFNHSVYYPFTGAHQSISNDCNACHKGNYTTTPNTCAGCHLTDYQKSVNPSHPALGLSTDCASCHTTAAGWAPATFSVHNNYYALNGAHRAVANDCAICHKGNYTTTPNTCFGCHSADYNQATNPSHLAEKLPTDCKSCHSEQAWAPSTFNHGNYYPLTGAHQTIANDCSACHKGNYTTTPSTCAGCHTTAYQQATSPNHVTLKFSMDCASCHSTNPDWRPATFNHSAFYPLNGAHALIANNCIACHINGNYTTTPNTCFGCHSRDYNTATNPNHLTARFPTTCDDCHSESAWSPSTFNHDRQYFPIYSGTHRGEWTQCIECHTTAGNFTTFSCTTCHEHNNPTELASDHRGVSGYQYLSSACYACHPDGSD